MTYDEALRELGIDGNAEGDSIRRAYLRLLKTRKPEVDPEGFKRLREAFEVAKNARGWMPLEPAPREDARAPAQVPAPAPASAPAPEASMSALSPMQEISELLNANKPLAASKKMRACFDDARVNHGVVLPPLGLVLATLLRLNENGKLDAATALYESVKRWLDMTGDEARILRGPQAGPWALTSELLALPATFDEKMRVALARGIREGDPSRAQDRLHDLQVLDPGEAQAIARHLQTRAPILARAMGAALTKRRQIPKSNISWYWIWIPLMLASQVGRCLSGTSSSHEMPRETPVLAYSAASPSPVDLPAADPSLADAERAARALADTARAEHEVAFASKADRVCDALNAGSCPGAYIALYELIPSIPSSASSTLQSRMLKLQREFAAVCTSTGTRGTDAQ